MPQPICGTPCARKVSPCRNLSAILLKIHLALALSGCAATDSKPEPDRKGDLPTGSITRNTMAASPQRPAMAGSSSEQSDEPAVATSVTLEGAIRRAVAFNPNIKEAKGRLAEQQEQVNVARAGYFPRIQGGLTSNVDSIYGTEFAPAVNLTASQMIFDFGKVSGSVAAADAGKAMRDAELLMETDVAIRDTADALIEVQRNRALAKAAAEQVAGLAAIGALVRQRVEKGGSSRSDETQTEARIEAAQATLMQYQTQRARWETALTYLIGGAPIAEVATDVPAWVRQACDQTARELDHVPRVAFADAARRQAIAELRQSHAQALPTVSLKGEASYDLVERGSNAALRYTIGLAASGSLYEGGATTARRRAAAHREAAARSAIDIARLETGRDLAQAKSETTGLKELLTGFATRKKWSGETRDLYERQYLDLGTRSLLDLLNAEFELHAVEFERINTEHDLRKLGIDCLFEAGLARASFGIGGPAASSSRQKVAAQ